MKQIFEPVTLGRLELKNRMVRSATVEFGAAEGGVIRPLLMKIYEELAQGEVGLIITGMMGVSYHSCSLADMVRVYKEEFVADFSEITGRVHECNSKIVVQLAHCGVKANVVEKQGLPIGQGPSDYGDSKGMTKAEIDAVVKDFGRAALKCKEAKADGVQIHGAHGYLLSQFLSPYFNHRTDEYGGDIQNRARLLFEVYEEVRKAVGDGYPIMVKINADDLKPEGIQWDEFLWVCRELEKRGIDCIEVSSGIGVDIDSKPSRPVRDEEDEGYFAEQARKLSADIRVPVISVGGYRTPTVIEKQLNSGNIAAVALCRPLICEPSLIKRWKSGDRSKARCISCTRCMGVKEHGCQATFQ